MSLSVDPLEPKERIPAEGLDQAKVKKSSVKSAPGAPDYLSKLNTAQRAAVEHGSEAKPDKCPPLLVIAGAGSGKTNTLAHRVAHRIVNGADPTRILLMTFSRRAASEMIRRVERIAAQILGQKAEVLTRVNRHSP